MPCVSCGVQTAPVRRGRPRKYCRPCAKVAVREKQREWYVRNKQITFARARLWKSKNPEKVAASCRRHYERHRDRINAVTRAWEKRNPEKKKEYRLRHVARRRTQTVEPVDRRSIWLAYSERCGICGKRVSLADMHLDHIVPLSKGGDHSPWNVQPAHELCNKRKHTKTLSVHRQVAMSL